MARLTGDDLAKPTIHLNGSSAEMLLEQLTEAAVAISDAIDKVIEAAPNGRDYYLQDGDAFKLAVAQHRSRIDRLQSVMLELNELAQHVSEWSHRRD